MATKDSRYESIEEQPLVAPAPEQPDPQEGEVKPQLSKNFAIAAAAILGSCAVIASRKSASTDVPLYRAALSSSNVALPSYLTALDETDPEWAEHSWRVTSSWVIGEPGRGNLIPDKVDLVRFNEPHFVFRTYGGENKAKQCGYWWVMDPPSGPKDSYFDHFAICKEWNDATDIIRCRVPEGYIAVVGEGQSVDCPETKEHLKPDSANLQLNGDICTASIMMEKHLSCEYCAADAFDLEKSACSNRGPNYIDGFEFSN